MVMRSGCSGSVSRERRVGKAKRAHRRTRVGMARSAPLPTLHPKVLMERAMKMIHVAFLVFASLLAAPAAAETYPTRAIKLLVPIPPGGAPDVAARLIGRFLSEALGQAVVIENRTGANGNIAAEAVAQSDPDGYTLVLGAASGIAINPHV